MHGAPELGLRGHDAQERSRLHVQSNAALRSSRTSTGLREQLTRARERLPQGGKALTIFTPAHVTDLARMDVGKERKELVVAALVNGEVGWRKPPPRSASRSLLLTGELRLRL